MLFQKNKNQSWKEYLRENGVSIVNILLILSVMLPYGILGSIACVLGMIVIFLNWKQQKALSVRITYIILLILYASWLLRNLWFLYQWIILSS